MLKINCNVVLKDMIEKAEQAGGDTFYRYNAVTANCQRFISVLMNSSGITGTDNFVMQDKSLWSLYGDSADFGIFHRSPHTLCVGSHPLGSCLQSYSKHW
jgi:hypothetical protein